MTVWAPGRNSPLGALHKSAGVAGGLPWYRTASNTCCSCTAREGKPVRLRRWSATVNGASLRRHHEPGYLEVRLSSHRRDTRTGARCDPAGAEFSGSRSGKRDPCHIIRRTLMGASSVGVAVLLASATLLSTRTTGRRRIGTAPDPAVRGGPVRRDVDCGAAGRQRQHRGPSSRLSPPSTASSPWLRRTWTRAPADGALTYVEANAERVHHRGRRRRPGATGRADPRRARHGCRPDQLRGNEPRVTSAGHRADLRTRRRDCSGRSSS